MQLVKHTPRRKIKKHISDQFRASLGYELDFQNPQTFNAKLQWLKLNYRDPLLTMCADKYAVREYVNKTIGEEYLIDLIEAYNSADDIDFDALPDKFVLKVNNGSGKNIICEDKSRLDVAEARNKLAAWMRPEASHYFFSYEWCYKNIIPKIVCEQYIAKENQDLKDYKFLSFGGNVEMLFVCSERGDELKVDFYNLNWQKLPFTRHYKNSKKRHKKPANFDLMVELATKLAEPFPFVRVDFYEVNGKVYFGELTFYPGNGMEEFTPIEWDYKLGELLKLPAANVWASWPRKVLKSGRLTWLSGSVSAFSEPGIDQ